MQIVNRRSEVEEKERTGATQIKKGGEDGELEDKVRVLLILVDVIGKISIAI